MRITLQDRTEKMQILKNFHNFKFIGKGNLIFPVVAILGISQHVEIHFQIQNLIKISENAFEERLIVPGITDLETLVAWHTYIYLPYFILENKRNDYIENSYHLNGYIIL